MSSPNSQPAPECTEGNHGEEKPRTASDYDFNDAGKLVDSEGLPYKFTTQAEYEKLGEHVTSLIYEIMQRPPYSMLRVPFDLQQLHQPVEQSPTPPDSSSVFVSPNFRDARNLVVLIHGSGKVQAGQWSRKLIINESLEIGSQLPYIGRCLEKGWAVLVLNTNDNYYTDDKGEEVERKKEMSASPEEHARYVWRRFVSPARYEGIAIVAHSYGGVVVANILASSLIHGANHGGNQSRLSTPIKCVCLTDAVFLEEWAKEAREIGVKVRNWVCSAKPLDEKIGARGWKVSAGTEEHERTSHSAINPILACIEESFIAE